MKKVFFYCALTIILLLIAKSSQLDYLLVKFTKLAISKIQTNTSNAVPDLAANNFITQGLNEYFPIYNIPHPPINLNPVVSQSKEQLTRVNNLIELQQAINMAESGSIIQIEPGTYQLENNKISINKTHSKNLTIQASALGQVTIISHLEEAMYINQAGISIKNLVFIGACTEGTQCEHAVHLVGSSDNAQIENNKLVNFNAHIKSNGLNKVFPHHVSIINNQIYNENHRKTTNPVTPIDIVGGNNWLIAGNFIADFSKALGDQISYGVFLKGGGKNGKIQNNIIACHWKLAHKNVADRRIGASIGGGGTGKSVCQNSCNYEHAYGEISKNLILNCSNEHGIYINNSIHTKIANNKIYSTYGLQINSTSSNTRVINNSYQGWIYAKSETAEKNNLVMHYDNNEAQQQITEFFKGYHN